MKVVFVSVVMFLVGCGSTNKIKLSGNATTTSAMEARIVIDYPQSEHCFTSPLIDTYEKLKTCLELTTNQKYTVDVNGDITNILEDVKDLEGAADGAI